jgi:hypothetical protein
LDSTDRKRAPISSQTGDAKPESRSPADHSDVGGHMAIRIRDISDDPQIEISISAVRVANCLD